MARYYYRKGDDPGIEKVRPWIEKWYGDSSDLRIEERVLTIDSLIEHDSVSESVQYLKAAHKRQSSLHAFLKLIARNWLEKEYKEEPVYEQEMYFVDEDAIQNISFEGLDLDPKISQLLPKGDKLFTASYGSIIVADVFCSGCSVEVGSTQPFNLCMPLLESLADKSVWIPFPRGAEKKVFSPDEPAISEVIAYELSLEDIA